MAVAFLAPASLLARKPGHGAPCTRCGLCCMATLCDLGQHIFRRQIGPCPALSFDANGSRCGLIDNGTASGRAAAAVLVGSGTGCDARFNGEPINHEYNARMARWDAENADRIRAAKSTWGMP